MEFNKTFLSKFMNNYFLKTGQILGICPYSFDNNSFAATKNRILRIYSCVFCLILVIFQPVSTIQVSILYRDYSLEDGPNLILKLVEIFESIMDNTVYMSIVWCIVFMNQNKILSSMNQGIEISKIFGECSSKMFQLFMLSKIILLDWMFFILLGNLSIIMSGKILAMICMINYFTIDFTINIMICAYVFAAHFYKKLNKDLNALMIPLRHSKKLTLTQMLKLSDEIDHKMCLHAKIGNFVNDLNQIFSVIFVTILLRSFVVITAELYTLYVFSRRTDEHVLEGKSLSMYLTAYDTIEYFIFVYVSVKVTEQFQRTGDILKVFLADSVDDRLKNSVSSLEYAIMSFQ